MPSEVYVAGKERTNRPSVERRIDASIFRRSLRFARVISTALIPAGCGAPGAPSTALEKIRMQWNSNCNEPGELGNT